LIDLVRRRPIDYGKMRRTGLHSASKLWVSQS